MLWFASKLLAGIFSFASSGSGRKTAREPAQRRSVSARSSLTTLVDDGTSTSCNDYPKTGRSGSLKRARSDATICSVVESNENAVSRGDADADRCSPRKKRRRTFLGTADTELTPHTLRDPHMQRLLPEHTHEYAPPSSPEAARTKALSESDISLPTTSPHARRYVHLLDGEVAARHDIQTKRYAPHAGSSSAMDKPHKCKSFEEQLGPKTPEVRAAAHDAPSSNLQTGIHHSVVCNRPRSLRSASSDPVISSSKSAHPCSHELSSKSAAPEGELTRIEITFEKLYGELLCSRDHESLIQGVAQRISASSRWLGSYLAYKETLRWTRHYARSGFRKNRFMDLMNLIVEEAPKCGLSVSYAHQLRYDRYNYDGSGWSPEKYTEDRSSTSESRDSESPEQNGPLGGDGSSSLETAEREPFEDDMMSPCIGTIAGNAPPGGSAWERAAVIVDVYNPSNEDSPQESRSTSTGRGPPEEPEPSSPPLRPRRVKGMPYHEHDPYPRMSWTELEQDFYAPRKFDTELAANATRVFRATGNRRHVVGVYVHHLKVRFCIYDRSGTIYTTPLDLRSDAQHIIAALISLSFLDAFSLGLEPYLASKTPASPSSLLQGGTDYVIDVDGLCLRTNSLLHAGEIFFRATAVFSATLVPVESSEGARSALATDVPSRVAVKMSWHTTSSHSENELLRLAEERGVQGVVRLYRSTVVHRVSEGLRSRLVPAPMYADRELHVQVIGPLARPLYEVSNLETFKMAFRSLVKIHHDLFEKAGILHRDISVGNLMVDLSNPSQGVLIDLDFAARVAAHGDPPDGEVFPPAGTINFRAVDLLTPNKPLKAYYRHDLESFFYTLLWIQMHYVDGKKLEQPWTKSCDFDFGGTWDATLDEKTGFLLNGCYPSGHQLPSTSLRDQWLAPMRRFFGEAINAEMYARVSHRHGEGALLDRQTLGGRITYDTFAAILRR